MLIVLQLKVPTYLLTAIYVNPRRSAGSGVYMESYFSSENRQ
jgi:hypothetical protein